jgi:hypothetical protein
VAVWQVPVPLQLRAFVNVVPEHVAAAHCVPALYRRQAPLPLHMPSVLQLDAPRSAHWPSGSWPPGTLPQVPTVPVIAHDWQVPLHAVAQQTPWAQNPDRHSPLAPHPTPVDFFAQLPPMQVKGATQSVSTVHVVRHAALLQLYGSHIDVVAAWQVPVPLHDRDDVSVELVQVAAPHWVPAAYCRQPPEPLQKPSVPQLFMPWSVHWFSGSVPVGTLAHAPSDPASPHDRHVPVHAVAQQVPCSQNPVWHSLGAPQAMPVGFFAHAPATHTFGAAQSASAVHDVLHTAAPQT